MEGKSCKIEKDEQSNIGGSQVIGMRKWKCKDGIPGIIPREGAQRMRYPGKKNGQAVAVAIL